MSNAAPDGRTAGPPTCGERLAAWRCGANRAKIDAYHDEQCMKRVERLFNCRSQSAHFGHLKIHHGFPTCMDGASQEAAAGQSSGGMPLQLARVPDVCGALGSCMWTGSLACSLQHAAGLAAQLASKQHQGLSAILRTARVHFITKYQAYWVPCASAAPDEAHCYHCVVLRLVINTRRCRFTRIT